MPTQKPCTKCTTPKELKDFYKKVDNEDGRHNICIACMRQKNATDYQKRARSYKKVGVNHNSFDDWVIDMFFRGSKTA